MSKEEKIEVEFGTKTERLFTDLKERTEKTIANIEKEIEVQKAVLDMCGRKIKEEQK